MARLPRVRWPACACTHSMHVAEPSCAAWFASLPEQSAATTAHRSSVLDPSFVWHLGRFDIVFSWGVLHHTGQMHRALANLAPVVRPDGMLMVTLCQGGGKCVLLPAIPRAKAQPIAFPGCLGYIALTPCSESLHPPQPAAALA